MKGIILAGGRGTNKSERFINYFITALLLVFCFLFADSLTHQYLKLDDTFLAGVFAAALILITLAYKRLSPIKPVYTAAFVFALAFLIRFAFVIILPSKQYSDYKSYYDAAVSLSKGLPYTGKAAGLIGNFPELHGFIMINAGLMFLFGTNIKVLLTIGCLASAGTAVLIFLILYKRSETAAFLASFAYALYPGNIAFSSILTNQHLATFFYYASFIVLLQKGNESFKFKARKLALTGLFMGIAQVIRPIAAPIVIAVLIYYILTELFSHREAFRKLLHSAAILSFALVYISVNLISSLISCNLGLKKDILDLSTDMRVYIIVGLDESTDGQISARAGQFREADEATKKQMLSDAIKVHLHNTLRFLRLALRKLNIVWGGADNSAGAAIGGERMILNDYKKSGGITKKQEYRLGTLDLFRDVLNKVDIAFMLLVMFFAIIGIWATRKDSSGWPVFFKWMLLGNIALRMIIEVQQRYRYVTMPAFIIFAAIGFLFLWEQLGQIKFIRDRVLNKEIRESGSA